MNSKAKQYWGSAQVATKQNLVEENTWSLAFHYQAPWMTTFSFKAGNKDYVLNSGVEASGEHSAKLKTSELSLKKKYS